MEKELKELFSKEIQKEFGLKNKPQDIVFLNGEKGNVKTVVILSSKQYQIYSKQNRYDLNKRTELTKILIRKVFNIPEGINIKLSLNSYGDINIILQ